MTKTKVSNKKANVALIGGKKGVYPRTQEIDLYDPYCGYDYDDMYGYSGYYCGGSTINYVTTKTSPAKTKVDVKKNPRLAAIARQMAAKQNAYYPSYEAAKENAEGKENAYFPTSRGLGVVQTRVIDGNTVRFVSLAAKCPLFEDPVEGVLDICIVNKVPKELFVEILGSFNRIYKAHHKEAAAQIWKENATGRYFVYYPEQDISGAQVKYTNDKGMLDLQADNTLVMEWHSHHSMAAFWSGTDDNNETTTGLYGVIGTIDKDPVTYKFRYKSGTVYENIDLAMVFDMTPEEEAEILKQANISEGNPEIDTKVKTTTYTTYSIGWNSCYSNYNTGETWLEREAREKKEATVKLFDAIVEAGEPDIITRDTHQQLTTWMWKISSWKDGKQSALNYTYNSFKYCWEKQGPITAYEHLVKVAKKDGDKNNSKKNHTKAEAEVKSENTANVSVLNSAPAKETPKKDSFASVNVSPATRVYCRVLAKVWNGGEFKTEGTNASEVAKFFMGQNSDTKRLILPGENELLPVGIPDTTSIETLEQDSDRMITDVEVSALARTRTQRNLELAIEPEVDVNNTLNDDTASSFIESIIRAHTATKHGGNYSFDFMGHLYDPITFASLLTNEEKQRLAYVMDCSIKDVTTGLNQLEVHAGVVDPSIIILLYQAILVPQTMRDVLKERIKSIVRDYEGMNPIMACYEWCLKIKAGDIEDDTK